MNNQTKEESTLIRLIRERKNVEKNRKKEVPPELKKKRLKLWTTFYRRNINIYIHRRLGINIHPFQHVMIYLMSVSKTFFAICSRGLAKTFDVAVYAIAKCMLYPYSEVVITATTIEQARRMVKDKMVDEIFAGKVSSEYKFLKYLYDNEYIKVIDSDKEIKVEFTFNGSWIKILPANENSRGSRATLLIYEECRLLKKSIIDSVFSKMSHPRQAVYKNLPQYATDDRWLEECQSVFITSAKYTSDWFWSYFKMVVNQSFTNKTIPYNFFAGDIFLSLIFGLKTEADYYDAKNGSNELEHRIEDLNEMLGEAEDAFFKRDMFKKNQVSNRAYKFPTIQEVVQGTDLKNRVKEDTEVRLLWIDFAFSNTTGKEENDQSVIGCYSLINRDGKFKRICDYITTHPASDSDGIDLRIREMFFDYKADYIVLDLRNGGEVMYNDLTKERAHPQRASILDNTVDGWNSHGFTVSNETNLQVVSSGKLDDLKARAVDEQAIPCIIPITATAELNSTMWLDLQKKLKNEEIDFLIEDIEFEQEFGVSKEFFTFTDEEKARIRLPYIMTMALINEAVNLSQEWKGGLVRLATPRIGTKDIIVALSYGNYITTLIENKLEKNDQQSDFDIDAWSFLGNL